jgi:hypothetical protein
MLKHAYSAAVGLITRSLNGIEILRPGKIMSRVAVEHARPQAQTLKTALPGRVRGSILTTRSVGRSMLGFPVSRDAVAGNSEAFPVMGLLPPTLA